MFLLLFFSLKLTNIERSSQICMRDDIGPIKFYTVYGMWRANCSKIIDAMRSRLFQHEYLSTVKFYVVRSGSFLSLIIICLKTDFHRNEEGYGMRFRNGKKLPLRPTVKWQRIFLPWPVRFENVIFNAELYTLHHI